MHVPRATDVPVIDGVLDVGWADLIETLQNEEMSELEAIEGWVMVVRSAAFDDRPVTLTPDPRLHLTGLYTEEATNWTGGPIETESAKPFSAPQAAPVDDKPRRMGSAILALVILLVIGGVLWLIL